MKHTIELKCGVTLSFEGNASKDDGVEVKSSNEELIKPTPEGLRVAITQNLFTPEEKLQIASMIMDILQRTLPPINIMLIPIPSIKPMKES